MSKELDISPSFTSYVSSSVQNTNFSSPLPLKTKLKENINSDLLNIHGIFGNIIYFIYILYIIFIY